MWMIRKKGHYLMGIPLFTHRRLHKNVSNGQGINGEMTGEE
jgi:hypothetical protein